MTKDELAKYLGTYIPCEIPVQDWSLPILIALLKRIEALEDDR